MMHQKFIKVLDYIEANLDGELDIKQLCHVAHLSKYHFHRQCSAYFGMPVASLVRLLRLKRAGYQLAFRNEMKVVDIALNAGFESHEAFSRAFKKHFSLTPTNFRKKPDWTQWHIKYDDIIAVRRRCQTTSLMPNIDIVSFEETLIATIEHRGDPRLVGNSIRRFIDWRRENNLPPSSSKTFNLIYSDPNLVCDDEYQLDIGCAINLPVQDNAHGVVTKRIPAGECAVLRHVGSDDTLGASVNFLYETWLADSSYQLRDFPIFLERVRFFPEVAEREMVTDIYLPITK
ncbi:AraC family transcriptional regulator [Pseudoalteromonas luteoviolacea]|uniref:AraC family transcriptional regulator n=1 Tax=Pseudoalteromonas luteoviolacea TaxID=43657 RepID=UPI001B37D469|nr:AraC family transcriptional regulator [Pseudoalteromonas luteoviolacea]MBQ4811612.1 AraC family transcriptional regulator [Pseudoalteromonas luteoviolacea]